MFASPGYADFSGKEPLHHFFNAQLLNPGEGQVSIATNGKYGVAENWEIGTNGIMILLGLLNVSAKHKMFRVGDFQTSFNLHTFYGRSTPGSEEDEDTTSDPVDTPSYTVTNIISLHGPVTTWRINKALFLNFGMMDLFARQSVSEVDTKITMHVLSPVIGGDFLLGKHLALSWTSLIPAYSTLNLTSAGAGIEGTANLLDGDPSKTALTWLTGILSLGSWNVELGTIVAGTEASLWFNMWWRFH